MKDEACLWKSGQLDGVALFKARFNRFVYTKHIHEEFAIGVIEKGAQRFDHGGSTHVAPASAIITVNPGEVHNGKAATEDGYQYRMSYIPVPLIREICADYHGFQKTSDHLFPSPVTFDPQIAVQLRAALLELDVQMDSLLESQTRFIQIIAELFRRHARPGGFVRRPAKDRKTVQRACEYICEHASQDISLDEIARQAGLSRFHFLRLFKESTGLPPHAFLIQQRLELARHAIDNGDSIADAALQSGFSDQSHLTRRFKAAFGITPGQYKKAVC